MTDYVDSSLHFSPLQPFGVALRHGSVVPASGQGRTLSPMDETEILPGNPPCVVHHRFAQVNGARLHYVEAGSGPPIVLLHGFPEFWYSWRHQIPALAAAGCHVLAPDQRGYNLSDKPRGVKNYDINFLVDDIVGLIRHLGYERATVVGHDWGGGVAWSVAMKRPEIVEKLIVLNSPHPAAFARELRTLRQMLKSWYIAFFQMPVLPEWWISRDHFAMLDRMLRADPTRPGAFSDKDVRLYKEALAQPRALTATVNWYRAAFRRGTGAMGAATRRLEMPTLLIWGEKDRYLNLRLTEGLDQWIANLRIERIPEASHWVQVDAAERVNTLMIAFLQGQ